MAHAAHDKSVGERELSRGGKSAGIWLMSLALFCIAFAIAATVVIRDNIVSPPARPGTTSATTTAGETKPPSPEPGELRP